MYYLIKFDKYFGIFCTQSAGGIDVDLFDDFAHVAIDDLKLDIGTVNIENVMVIIPHGEADVEDLQVDIHSS